MKRQLQKVIFLPANEIVLTDSEFVGPRYEDSHKTNFLNSLIKRISGKRQTGKLDMANEYNYQGSIWKAIEYSKTYGYKILLYPELNSGLSFEYIFKTFIQLKEKNIVDGLLNGNTTECFLQAIQSYDINPHNSVFVSKEYEMIEQLLQYFFPRNGYIKNKIPDKPIGFYFIYWNTPQTRNDNFSISSNGTNRLPFDLTQSLKRNYLMYSSVGIPFMHDKIIYIEENCNEAMNTFIHDNYQWILSQIAEKGCSFIYFPELIYNQVNYNFISEYIHYFYPGLSADYRIEIETIVNGMTPESLQNLFLEYFNFPAFGSPILIRNLGTVGSFTDIEYSIYRFETNKDIKEQFEYYLKNLNSANASTRRFFQLAKSDDTVDSKFYPEAQKLAEDVIQKIEYLKQGGMNSLLAEIAVHLFDQSKQILPEPIKKLEIKANASPVVSRLRIEWTSKYDFRILLPDYGNMIVEMSRLPKALYYFFLQHPEGVMLNSLADYHNELLAIYSRISNKSNKDEITENIDRLVDPFDNSVNVNCSRIKSAFVKLIDERLADRYFITGYRGEPKKVALSPDLIEIVGIS